MDKMPLGGWDSPAGATGPAGGTDRPSHCLGHGDPRKQSRVAGRGCSSGPWGADIRLPAPGLGSVSPFDFFPPLERWPCDGAGLILLLRPAAISLWCGLLWTLALSLSLVPNMGGKANVYLLFHKTKDGGTGSQDVGQLPRAWGKEPGSGPIVGEAPRGGWSGGLGMEVAALDSTCWLAPGLSPPMSLLWGSARGASGHRQRLSSPLLMATSQQVAG